MNLVVGATGMVGTEVCRLLAASGKPVRALVRSTSDQGKVEKLKGFGAAVVQGDLRDAATLRAACKGVSAVFSTASAMPFAYAAGVNTPQTTDRDGHMRLIDEARAAGVKQFVFLSFPPMPVSMPLQDAKRAVEERLKESGLSYTILQPTFFMEVWLSPAVGFDYSNHTAALYGPGENAISWISYRDVAQFAVASLSHAYFRNAVQPLGGPEAISPCRVVGIFEKVGGKPFTTSHLAVGDLQRKLEAATDPMEKSFAGLMLGVAGGGAVNMTEVLKELPLNLVTVEGYARSVMG